MRKVLTILAAVVVVAAGAFVFVVLPGDDEDGSPSKNLNAIASSTFGGFSALELDGVSMGRVKVLSGGEPFGEVTEEVGPEGTNKRLVGPRFSPIVLEFGTGLASPLYALINDVWSGQRRLVNGNLVDYDSQGREISRTDFTNAGLTATQLPSADAAANAAASFRLTLAPEATRPLRPSGASFKAQPASPPLTSSAFRFSMDKNPQAVVKVDAFEVGSTPDVPAGGMFMQPESGRPIIPNLRLTIGAAQKQYWNDWASGFIVGGNNGDENERSGSLEFLKTDLTVTLARIDFRSCGPISLVPVPSTGGDSLPRVVVNLYCEQMSFTSPG